MVKLTQVTIDFMSIFNNRIEQGVSSDKATTTPEIELQRQDRAAKEQAETR